MLCRFPDDSAKDVNVTLVITNSAADFTSLDSFGNADSFASNLVNSMDQSYLLRAPKWARRGMEDKDIQVAFPCPLSTTKQVLSLFFTCGQVAKLIDSSKANGGYFVEYTIRNSSVQQHLISFIYLGFNGRYNRIYTITAQCPEDALHKYKSTFLAICKSFRVRDTTSLPE